MIIEEVKIADIKPYERNQKKHPESQVRNIAKSIEKYGFVQPIVIDKNNEIIIGHGRYMAGGGIFLVWRQYRVFVLKTSLKSR